MGNKYFNLNKRFDARLKKLLKNPELYIFWTEYGNVLRHRFLSSFWISFSFIMHAGNDVFFDQVKNHLTVTGR